MANGRLAASCSLLGTRKAHEPYTVKRLLMEITQRIHDGPDCYPWMEVFAWLPCRTVRGKWVWCRKIYKRRYWVVWGIGFHMEPHVEYGTLFDIIDYD